MGIWRLDKYTAEWIAKNAGDMPCNTRFELEECEKCGAQYFKNLGHKSCDDIIDIHTHDVSKDDSVE